MLITPTAPNGLKALVPQEQPPDQKPPPRSQDIVITVHRDRTIQLNQEAVELASLEDRLKFLFKNAANHVVFVRGDKDLDFGQIAEVIDIARGAGLERVALMPQ